MKKNQATYSQIISPELYNETISKQHIYIADADQKLIEIIKNKRIHLNSPEIVELGCGPGRFSILLVQAIPDITVTSIDHDKTFLEFAKNLLSGKNFTFLLDDITTYQHPKAVDFFISIGMHHHIAKDEETQKYLKNIFKQLKKGGYYLVSDEFLPEYTSNQDRDIKLIIWYSHVINHALANNYHELATEEAKTLLDDIDSGHNEHFIKSQKQVDLILEKVSEINNYAIKNNFDLATKASQDLLNELEKNCLTHNPDQKFALSRQDYKISRSAFIEEAQKAGFSIEDFIAIGPIDTIGAMGIFVLKKEH